MFEKTYILLNNNRKIKVKNLEIKDKKISFEIGLKYFNYFSSEETALKEGYFKRFFSKSNSFVFDNEEVPEYEVKNNKLKITALIEEL